MSKESQEEKEYVKNHFYPKFYLNYWKNEGATLYDKKTNIDRSFNPANTFYLEKYYYFDGTPDIEKRLSKVEKWMSEILAKIDTARKNGDKSFLISEWDKNYIILFLTLQSSRQLKTSEVILNDESGIYESNNYLAGTNRLENEKERKWFTTHLLEALESMLDNKVDENLDGFFTQITDQLHLVIAIETNPAFCISDICCFIENDMDSKHLFTFYPQTPYIGFFVVKSKYFYNLESLYYLASKNDDRRISMVLEKDDLKLLCSYEMSNFKNFTGFAYTFGGNKDFESMKNNNLNIKFVHLRNESVININKIFFDDGNQFIHCQSQRYVYFLKGESDIFRYISVSF